jgi:hypothetical protein
MKETLFSVSVLRVCVCVCVGVCVGVWVCVCGEGVGVGVGVGVRWGVGGWRVLTPYQHPLHMYGCIPTVLLLY